MNLKEISVEARKILGECFSDSHGTDVLLNRLESEILGCPSYLRVTEPLKEIPATEAEKFFSALLRICSGEPLQYVIGYETFYGRKFNVSPAVLIPRPETEELCLEIIKNSAGLERSGRKLRILDLCTGSGCIAWTLAAEITDSEVVAVDISPEALSVAMTQPLHIGNAPVFVLADVLAGPESFKEEHPELCDGGFDIIVSNPPYVRNSERKLMDSNVLDHEPELALFVPDEDPLLFYRAVAHWAESLLNDGGLCAVEINEVFPEDTARLFSQLPHCFSRLDLAQSDSAGHSAYKDSAEHTAYNDAYNDSTGRSTYRESASGSVSPHSTYRESAFGSVSVMEDMFSKPRFISCKDFRRK